MRPAAHVSDGARSGGSGAHAQQQTSSRHPPAQPPPQQILRVAVDPPRGPLCNHCLTRVQIDEEIIATKCNHAFCEKSNSRGMQRAGEGEGEGIRKGSAPAAAAQLAQLTQPASSLSFSSSLALLRLSLPFIAL